MNGILFLHLDELVVFYIDNILEALEEVPQELWYPTLTVLKYHIYTCFMPRYSKSEVMNIIYKLGMYSRMVT